MLKFHFARMVWSVVMVSVTAVRCMTSALFAAVMAVHAALRSIATETATAVLSTIRAMYATATVPPVLKISVLMEPWIAMEIATGLLKLTLVTSVAAMARLASALTWTAKEHAPVLWNSTSVRFAEEMAQLVLVA